MATRQFNIFVEGTDDHDLVLVLVRQLRATTPHPTKKETRNGQMVTTYLVIEATGDTIFISSIGGWENLGSNQSFSIREARDSGGKNLVVFDADEDPAQRAETLAQRIAADEPNPSLFLFPGPNQPGELETLLLQLVQPAHQAVMACYDDYENCLQKINKNDNNYYNTLSVKRRMKRRIHGYVNVMPLQGDEWERHHKKGGQKIFENPDLWDLNALVIQPLRDFLDLHIR